MRGVVQQDEGGPKLWVKLDGDPFPVEVRRDRVNKEVPRVARQTAKELRQIAKQNDIEGWEEMDLSTLREAVEALGSEDAETEVEDDVDDEILEEVESEDEEADEVDDVDEDDLQEADEEEEPEPVKVTARKAASRAKKPVKKKAVKRATTARRTREDAPTPPTTEKPVNPFRPNTNLWHITEALMEGGRRSDLVTQLLPKLKYNPRQQSDADFDPVVETDRRLKVVGYILRGQHGFEYSHEGRGPDAHIKVTPPSS